MSNAFLLCAVVIDEGSDPDWDAAREHIRKAARPVLDQAYEGEDPDDARASALAALGELEEAWKQGGWECDKFHLRGASMLFTGGISGGDAPTDLFQSIADLYAIGAVQAAGFDA
jgi:hypothetical protein